MLHVILLIIFFQGTTGDVPNVSYGSLNPTGTYKLDQKTTKRNGDVYGYFGQIRIKLIDSSKIAMSFYVCKGAPSYNSGSFIDTLDYDNSRTFYIPEDDSTCLISFKFTTNGIHVTQRQDNLNFGCGFGHGVFADGYYKRISKNVPEIEDLLIGED